MAYRAMKYEGGVIFFFVQMAYRAMKYEGGVIFILFKWRIEP
jgi:hypothetical protein